jgi:acetyl-CoA carboxylase biotin carboxylase subunit
VFEKILIANRGEIAVRIIRACHELGIRTVAVHSEADRDALHVKLADESVCIGPPPSARSYLNIPNIVSAALIAGADAIHPGVGFLAERHVFAEICGAYNVAFIGPTPTTIEQLGDKTRARQVMEEAGLPVLPGSDEPARSVDDARELAQAIGYPVMLRAVAGGGGRGIRLLRSDADLTREYLTAQAEAENAFANPGVYIEKFIEAARHVEVQVIADRFGNVVHLGERDCSIQRRQQKLVEEAPDADLSPASRADILEAAVRGARASHYTSAGTWEFLMDRQGRFYFMEANTRLQVEHPVTEAICGVDLVKAQIRLAAGEPLEWRQDDIQIKGHAIECRVNAEDGARGFAPSAGEITRYVPPGGPGVRVDSHIYTGYYTPTHYDSLLAKIITWGADREEAMARMRRALAECMIEGIATTIPFYQQLFDHAAFRRHDVSTVFVEEWLAQARVAR